MDDKEGTNHLVATRTHYQQKSRTFWTICNPCRMHYEYLRVYLRRKLRCPNCGNPFLGVEVSPPSTGGIPFPRNSNIVHRTCSSSQPTTCKSSNVPTINVASAADLRPVQGFSCVDSSNNTTWSSPASASIQTAGYGIQPPYQNFGTQSEQVQAAVGFTPGSSIGGSSSVGFTPWFSNGGSSFVGFNPGSSNVGSSSVGCTPGSSNGGSSSVGFTPRSSNIGSRFVGFTPGSFNVVSSSVGFTPGSSNVGSSTGGFTPGSFNIGSTSVGITPGSSNVGSSPMGFTPGSFNVGSGSFNVGSSSVGSSSVSFAPGSFNVGSSSVGITRGSFNVGSSTVGFTRGSSNFGSTSVCFAPRSSNGGVISNAFVPGSSNFGTSSARFTPGFLNGGSSSIIKGDKPQRRRRANKERPKGKEREHSKPVVKQESYGPNHSRELSDDEVKSMLMNKAKKEIREVLNRWSMDTVSDKAKTKAKQNAALQPSSVQSKISSSLHPEAEPDIFMTMSVPDPDFHDFDKDREESSFAENQVWAAYDDDDGMPRNYAMIDSVISLKPFKMRIRWLSSKSNAELGPINWIGSGFYKTCGCFRMGKQEVNQSLNSFSHKVQWTKGARGYIQIYPWKGEVWALYKNWSPDWNELTLNKVIHEYDMVEVLEDYNEEKGVTVALLVKVVGFKTVFRKQSEPSKTKMIPRQEMFRFSHKVPSYLLTGQEGDNAPKGCWELDPAASPPELLRVLTEEMMDIAENVREEDPLEGVQESMEEELMKSNETRGESVSYVEKKMVAAEWTIRRKETSRQEINVYRRRVKPMSS